MPKTNFDNHPTPERLAQAKGVTDNFKTDSGRKVKRLQSILDHMLSRGMIDQGAYTAGMMAYRQWYSSGLTARAVDLSQVRVDGGAGGNDPLQYKIDNGLKFTAAMIHLSPYHKRAFVEMVILETAPHIYATAYYGYEDRALAVAVAYSTLKDTLGALETHYSGGKRQAKSEIRSHMAKDGKPANRPDVRGS